MGTFRLGSVRAEAAPKVPGVAPAANSVTLLLWLLATNRSPRVSRVRADGPFRLESVKDEVAPKLPGVAPAANSTMVPPPEM